MKKGCIGNKKIIFKILLAIIIMSMNITAKADEVIPASEFEDNNFYQYIIENFDTNGDGLLQQSEAEAVTAVETSGVSAKITSIKGIEHLTNLKVLFIGQSYENHDIKSIEPIKNLTNIYALDIGKNPQITDFSPLFNLSKLEYFNAEGTKINDIGFLADMNSLTELRLRDCENITDFSILLELTGLRALDVSGNKSFKDIIVLRNMTNLADLNIGRTDIEDFSTLMMFENLSSLYIDYTDVKDISFLKGLSNLQQLGLDGCLKIEDFTVLEELTDLLVLHINNNISFASHAQYLSPLINMQVIELVRSDIQVLPDMTGWNRLVDVSIGDNKITEQEAMAKLPAHITSQENWRETTGLIYQRNNEDETDNNTQENETSSNTQENETLGNTNDGRVITSSSDNNISVQGSFVSDIYLEATKIENTSDYEDLIKEVNNRLPHIVDTSIYDIWLYKKEIKEGENVKIKVQPNGSVKVMIKIEEQEGVSYYVFRQEDDGTLTKLDCYVEDGTLIFYSEHFSIFTVVISRLMNDEENGTEGNSHKSDNGNYIKVQQQGIKVPLLHESERNGGGIARPTDKIKNKDNDGSENNNNGNGNISSISEAGSDDGSSSKDESSSTSWENVIESVSIPFDKRDTGKSEQRKNIEGIVCIVIVCMVGIGIFGYDIMKRKRGDYMRNFQIEAINTDLDIKQ